MGVAVWRRTVEAEQTVSAATERFRIVVLNRPRTPWRASLVEAMHDAARAGLASWDASRGRHYLAVPVDLQVDRRAAKAA